MTSLEEVVSPSFGGVPPPGIAAPLTAADAAETGSLPDIMSGGMSCACLTVCTTSATRDAVLCTVTSSSAMLSTACKQSAAVAYGRAHHDVQYGPRL